MPTSVTWGRVGVLGVLAAGVCSAAPRTLAIAVGDCRDPELLTGMTAFHGAAAGRLKGDVYDPEVVLELMRPRTRRSLDDIQRQVESARTLYYAGQHDRALELAKQAISDLERAPPRAGTWKVTADALLLQGLSYKAQGKMNDSKQAFRQVLRVDGEVTLDVNQFTPSTVAVFDRVRKDVARARRSALTVQSTPSGAEVFLDGRPLGRTPMTLQLIPGAYRLALAKDRAVSFARSVTVPRDDGVVVDMGLEGAVSTQTPLCIDAAVTSPEPALKLATFIAADRVIVLTLDSHRGDPPFFRATLYTTRSGTKVRDGGATRPQASTFADLVTFVVTGERGPGIVSGSGPPKSTAAGALQVPVATASPAAGSRVDAPASLRLTPNTAPAATTPPAVSSRPVHTPRLVAYGLLGGGAAAIAAGAFTWSSGETDRQRLAGLRTADGRLQAPSLPGHRTALDLMPRVDGNRAATFTLVGVGLGLVAAGVGTWVLFPQGPTVTAAVSPSGASVAAAGAF